MCLLNIRIHACLLLVAGILVASQPAGAEITLAERTQAVLDTIQQSEVCSTANLDSYYWEIGDKSGSLASGSVNAPGADPVLPDTVLKIASASKWLFASYLLERNAGVLNADDIRALTMKTGYTRLNYSACGPETTVETCFDAPHLLWGHNSDFIPRNLNKFYYNSGHFQKRAIDIGLGSCTNQDLVNEYKAYLTGFDFEFDRPQMAAGMKMSAGQYGVFLRKVLEGAFKMGDHLGADAVCTKYNLRTCPDAAWGRSSPVPSNWHYSLGHWVEDNTNSCGRQIGDGAYSSPGAFGFYPWIDHDRTYYGILARESHRRKAYKQSVYCGEKLRAAWEEGKAQR